MMRRKSSTSHQYTRPGRSKLGASVMERSPSPPPPHVMRRTSSEEAAIVLRQKNLEFPVPEIVRTSSPQRLMLAPPPDEQSRFSRMHTRTITVLNNPATADMIRVALFFVKIVSLFSACQPFAVQPWAAYSLLGVASLDLLHLRLVVSPQARRWPTGGLTGSLILLAVHAAAVVALWRRGRLCVRNITWEEF